MNMAERDFYKEAARKVKIEAENELRALVCANIETPDVVINFILNNKMQLHRIIKRMV